MVDLSELEQQFLGRLRAFLGNAGAINPELIEAIAGHMERMADQRLRKLAGSTGKADDAHAVRQYLEHWRGMDEPGDRCLVKALSREPCLFEVVRALVGWPPEGKQPTEPKEHARLVMEMLKSEDDDAKKALTKLHEFNVDPITEERLIQLFTEKPHAAAEVFRAAEWPRPFSLVFREELEQIEARRGSRAAPPSDAYTDALDLARCSNLFALAFSGGGIRSATFNLGVLQRLAEHGILKNVDYLSTVSGGGYIGSWLSAWSWRKGFARVCDWLSPTTAPRPHGVQSAAGPAPAAVQQLLDAGTGRLQLRHLDHGSGVHAECIAEPGHSGGRFRSLAADPAAGRPGLKDSLAPSRRLAPGNWLDLAVCFGVYDWA